jgi:serine/threonine-protein kinase
MNNSHSNKAIKLPPQTLIGKYVLGERLGVGGMAEVYEAQYIGAPNRIQRRALKLILPQWAKQPDAVKMFQAEARLWRLLHHPSIVGITDAGEVEGRQYIALEFIDGVSCARLLRTLSEHGRAMDHAAAVHITVRALSALSYAHGLRNAVGRKLGIVHRDVSPGNILLSRGGEVKLTDFGIALSDDLERNTRPGEVKGKFGYMSPEQIAGADIDQRSDLFSLGIVLAEMLTGQRLFTGNNQYDVLTRMHLADISAFERNCAQVPEELVAVVRRALRRRRRDRYQSAIEFLSELLNAAGHSGIEPSESAIAGCLFEFGMQHPQSGTHELAGDAEQPPVSEPITAPRG